MKNISVASKSVVACQVLGRKLYAPSLQDVGLRAQMENCFLHYCLPNTNDKKHSRTTDMNFIFLDNVRITEDQNIFYLLSIWNKTFLNIDWIDNRFCIRWYW